MKILHTEASCGWGGQEIRILEESRGLMARGHEVQIVCPPEARILTEAERFGVPATALPIGRKRLAGLLALRRWIRANAPQVINTHSSTDSWLSALACATLAAPPALVRTRHISAAVADNAPHRWLYGRAVRRVVTTGEALRRHLIETLSLPATRVVSIPTGIDPQRFRPGDRDSTKRALGLDPGRHYIGIVATLRSWKGHLFLLEAFARLAAPGWELLIVGDGPMREQILERIAALGIGERVRLVGQQNAPEEWLRALDIFCLPSYANEGVPQAIMQAMLSALPIVTTAAGAIGEAVSDGETGLVVPMQDAAALAEAITRLIADADLRETLGRQAHDHAGRHFTLDDMLNRMQEVFDTAAGERR